MQRFSRKTRRLARVLGVKAFPDPDGVIAVLQIARRLVKETGADPVVALGDAADEFASPKDSARAWWAAYRAFANRAGEGDVLAQFDAAISAQGRMNQLVRKGPR